MCLNLCGYGQGRSAKVVLMGLDGAGKSTLFHRFQRGELANTTPTVGFNVGTVEPEDGPELTMWDVGGQGAMRVQWGRHLEGCAALAFVVDGSDRGRIGEARGELGRVLGDEKVKGVPLMVLVNKMDLPEVMEISEVLDRLGLQQCWDRDWEIRGCSSHTGIGLQQALGTVARLIIES